MDLTLLDSILECSVCLDRLKSDSRVLPCQHTFCWDCLKRVRNKSPNVPLSCPECRQQTNIFDVDALPKNVFLIRLLDQLIIKPTNGSNEQQISTPKATTTSVNNKTIELDKQQTAPVLKPQGEMQQQQATVPYAKALYDFKMNPIEDEGCLKFQKGMIIHVTRRVDQNWAEGKLGEAVGIFPLSFVQMNQAASSLMQSYANKWRLPVSLNSTANNEQSPSTSTSPQRQLQPPPPVLQPTPAPPNLTRPKSVPSNSQTTTTTTQQFCSQISSDKTGTYIALHNYSPQKPDELELKKGSQYIVKEACQDGWLKGCCSDNLFKKGVFPGNYVMPMVYHQMMEMQRNLALKAMQAQKNQPNSNTQPMRTTGYTNHGLSSIPPELPQRNITAGVVATRSSQSPLSIMNKAEAPTDSSTAQTQKTDDNVNKQKKESVTEMLMKRLGYNRKSNDSSAYSIDNPVFEDSSTTSVQPLHMRSGSCPIDLGAANVNIENLQFGSQRVKTRERCALTTMNNDDKQIPSSQKRHSINLSGPPSTSKNPQNTQLKAQHRKSTSLDTTLDGANPPLSPERYRCVTKYPANSRFELSLNVGDIVILQKKRDNGWYKGELSRTGQVGLFPANFVELIEQ